MFVDYKRKENLKYAAWDILAGEGLLIFFLGCVLLSLPVLGILHAFDRSY